MTWIIKIQFGKSRSASYSDIVKFARSLPNFSEDNGIITCGAKQIREYIMYHTELEGLIPECILRRRTAAGAVTNGRRAV